MKLYIMLSVLLQLLVSSLCHAEMLNEDEIRKLVTGNTITGRYTFGGWFSEFHSEDGRVLGNNGWEDNSDACWSTKPSTICYSYGKHPKRQTYCFGLERSGESLILRNMPSGAINAIVKMETGNQRSHSDSKKNWSCEEKISSLHGSISSTPQSVASCY